MSVTSALERLVGRWTELGHPIVHRLLPGLPQEELLAAVAPAKSVLHPDVLEFYRYCGGSDPHAQPQAHARFFDGYWVPTPAHAAQRIAWRNDELEGDGYEPWEDDEAEEPSYTPAGPYFPILQEDANLYAVANLPAGPGASPVFSVSEYGDCDTVFDSVEAMLHTMYRWYDEGVLTVDLDGIVDEIDYDRYLQIAEQENPAASRWAYLRSIYPRRY